MKTKTKIRIPWLIVSLCAVVAMTYLVGFGCDAVQVNGVKSYDQPWFVEITQLFMVIPVFASWIALIFCAVGTIIDECEEEEKKEANDESG